jgi:hypothetical protein
MKVLVGNEEDYLLLYYVLMLLSYQVKALVDVPMAKKPLYLDELYAQQYYLNVADYYKIGLVLLASLILDFYSNTNFIVTLMSTY